MITFVIVITFVITFVSATEVVHYESTKRKSAYKHGGSSNSEVEHRTGVADHLEGHHIDSEREQLFCIISKVHVHTCTL